MEEVIFKNILLFTDKAYNEAFYKAKEWEPCECLYCQNFEAYKSQVFPKECLELFEKLGVDAQKYAEIMEFPDINGLHSYIGWFHFKGDFKLLNNNEITEIKSSETFKITENFSLSFDFDKTLTLFPPLNDLVQIQFEVKIPWLLKKLP